MPISDVCQTISPSLTDNSFAIPSPNYSDASGSPHSFIHPSLNDVYSNQAFDQQNYQPINYSTF